MLSSHPYNTPATHTPRARISAKIDAAVSDTTDIKTIERIDRPARRLILWGGVLLGGGLLLNVSLGEIPGVDVEKWDGVAAVIAVIGGLKIVAAIVVRILQKGRREDIRQEPPEPAGRGLGELTDMAEWYNLGAAVERRKHDDPPDPS